MSEKFPILHNRWIRISGLLLILAGLLYYGHQFNPEINLSMCLKDPTRYDGREIPVGTEAKVIKRLADGFILQEMGHTIRVKGDLQDIAPGEYVRMRAIFHKEGYLELKRIYVAEGRRLKIFLSIVPAVLVLFLLFKIYRFDWRRMLFVERI